MPAQRSAPTPARVLRALAVLLVCAAGVVSAIALVSPVTSAPAAVTSASMHPLESMFQDDQHLVYSSTATVARTLDALRALGVDRLRITVLWSAIAPHAHSRTRPPGFDASDPAAYPDGAWRPYDRVLELARARGIGVDFDLTAPGPLWAMRRGAPIASEADHFDPSAAAFGRFALAAGRRYSGRYLPPGAPAGGPIPRVSFWSIWNEPNQPGWLAPQRSRRGRRDVVESARLYRGYVEQGVGSLYASGHRGDAILIGELAPEGQESRGANDPVPPIPFLQALYCVGRDYRRLGGAAASALGCPTGGARSNFVARHPGLFAATGFAHHPYSFILAPGASMTDSNFVALSDLARLERGLDTIFAAYSVPRQLPLYLTEYGYETDPPNPFRGVDPRLQAAYLDQAAYLAWRDPRVRSLSQFLLYDSPPDAAYPRGSVRYWSTFQTGLVFRGGAAKPGFYSYRLPIFIPSPSFLAGGEVKVWGMLRSAPNGTQQRARVQWRPAGDTAAGGASAAGWRTLAVVTTRDPTGALLAAVSPPGPGSIRLWWTSAVGQAVLSRAVGVTMRAGG